MRSAGFVWRKNRNNMRILYLSDEFPPHSYGGSGAIAKYIAQGVAAQGHQVFVVSTAKHIREQQEEPFENGTLFWIPQYNAEYSFRLGLCNVRSLEALERILKKVRPDVVHAHNLHWHLSYAALTLARKYTARVYLTAHDLAYVAYAKVFPKNKRRVTAELAAQQCKASLMRDLRAAKFHYMPWRTGAIRRHMSNARQIFCVSNFIKDALSINGIQHCRALHNGIAVERFAVARGSAEEFRTLHALGLSRVLFFGGRLGSAKGLHVLLDALMFIRKRFPDTLLLTAAREGESEEVKREAGKRGIADCIRYTGWLSEKTLPLAYAAATVAVTPSLYFDPFPTVNLEAMAGGKPVVGTCFGGTPEAIDDGITGFIVNPYDVPSLAEKLSALLADEKLAQRMGEAGRARVQKLFSLETHVQKTLEAYNA